MGRERAPSFADRLPPVVPKEETDISHLSDEMAEILYPGRRPRTFRIGIVFDGFEGPEGERALGLARRASDYREEMSGGLPRHHAAFETSGAGTLRELFQLVGGRPGTEILVAGKRVPYAREIWLPLYWIFVKGEES